MWKELKSWTGVLLRADLTGHSHPTHFGSFCSTTLLPPHIKKLETYFALFIFLDFRTVWFVDGICELTQRLMISAPRCPYVLRRSCILEWITVCIVQVLTPKLIVRPRRGQLSFTKMFVASNSKINFLHQKL